MNTEPPPIPPPRLPSAPPKLPGGTTGNRSASTGLSTTTKVVLWIGATLVVLFVGFIGFRGYQFYQWSKQPHAPTRSSAFYSATARLGPSGPDASGNSQAAVALAAEMSEVMQDVRDMGYEQAEKKSLLDTRDRFKTYCDLREDRCVFLVHVPELRRFTQSAQDSLAMTSWATAQTILKTNQAGKADMKLAVGIRGLVSYERVMTGRFLPASDDTDTGLDNVQKGIGSEKILVDWFVPEAGHANPTATNSAPKGVGL